MQKSRPQIKGWTDVKAPAARETGFHVVLSVSPNEEDCVSLERIFKSSLAVVPGTTVASALSMLKETPIPIVLCDSEIKPGSWREMLNHVSLLPDPPLLIVTSRLADERLWAEALNLGAWDVLAKPFATDEVTRIVSIAWQHWQDRHGVYGSRTQQRKATTGAREMAATGT